MFVDRFKKADVADGMHFPTHFAWRQLSNEYKDNAHNVNMHIPAAAALHIIFCSSPCTSDSTVMLSAILYGYCVCLILHLTTCIYYNQQHILSQ